MKRNAFSLLVLGVLFTGSISFVLGSLDENSRQVDEHESMTALNDFDQEAFEEAWRQEMANAELSEIEKADMQELRSMVKRSPKPLFGAIAGWAGKKLLGFAANKIAGAVSRPRGRGRGGRRRRWWGKK